MSPIDSFSGLNFSISIFFLIGEIKLFLFKFLSIEITFIPFLVRRFEKNPFPHPASKTGSLYFCFINNGLSIFSFANVGT
jgi:hypothetical protein